MMKAQVRTEKKNMYVHILRITMMIYKNYVMLTKKMMKIITKNYNHVYRHP